MNCWLCESFWPQKNRRAPGGGPSPLPDEKLEGSVLPSGPEKGVITKGVFSLEESLESLKSLSVL